MTAIPNSLATLVIAVYSSSFPSSGSMPSSMRSKNPSTEGV
jgi:hypothetical protein